MEGCPFKSAIKLPFACLTYNRLLPMVFRSFEVELGLERVEKLYILGSLLPDSVMEAHVTLTHRVQVRTLVGQPFGY